jgi:hypothetical protein
MESELALLGNAISRWRGPMHPRTTRGRSLVDGYASESACQPPNFCCPSLKGMFCITRHQGSGRSRHMGECGHDQLLLTARRGARERTTAPFRAIGARYFISANTLTAVPRDGFRPLVDVFMVGCGTRGAVFSLARHHVPSERTTGAFVERRRVIGNGECEHTRDDRPD